MMCLLYLLCYVGAAAACLQCDSSTKKNFEALVQKHPKDAQMLRSIIETASDSYKKVSRYRKGVIDMTTLYRASTEYKSEYNRMVKNKKEHFLNLAISIVEKGRVILEKHLDIFIRDKLCPNKCGFLKRKVMDCMNCAYKPYICPPPSNQTDCGELSLHSEEGEYAVLDCFLPWHPLIMDKTEYHYSRIPGSEKWEENETRTLVVTDESSVILNQLNVADQGIYRCLLQNKTGFIFTKFTFNLTVDPDTDQTQTPHRPPDHASLTFEPSEHVMMIILFIFVAVAATACVILIIYITLMVVFHKRELVWSQKKIKKLSEY